MNTTKPTCDGCGHPALFRDKHGYDKCEVCVSVDHGEELGEAYAAAQMFAAAAQMAVKFGVRKHELHALLAEALEHESRHEPLDINSGIMGACDERRSERRWLHRLEPVSGKAA